MLERNFIPPEVFTGAVYTALQLGAVRGANVACVGAGGCGKSTLLESLELIFACLEKPQAGSTFPFANIKECDVILWQDYEHNEGTLKFTDLLSLLVGESIGIRIPSSANWKFRNSCPCFYSGRTPLQCRRADYSAAAELNGMMAERFATFSFTVPLPFAERDKAFPKCGRCAAAFFLHGQGPPQQAAAVFLGAHGPCSSATRPHVGVMAAPMVMACERSAPPAPASANGGPSALGARTLAQNGPGLVDALQRLCELHQRGNIDAEEYAQAKRRLLAF